MPEDKAVVESEKNEPVSASTSDVVKKKRTGFLSRFWRGIFRIHGDDFEKRLKNISKEEATVVARVQRRSVSRRWMTKQLILFSVVFEVVAVGYAIMTTRTVDLDWKMRASRVLPMFLLPAFSSATYWALLSFTRMCDNRDQKTLERLRAERQAKINELKEKTNYYNTQQLIQRYDTDPAAKAAAASVLASKLGADSGLKVFMEDESQYNVPRGKSGDSEIMPPGGLRNRRKLQTRSSTGSMPLHQSDDDTLNSGATNSPQNLEHNQQVVTNHYPQGAATHDGSWISRVAALLVGEDPMQSYALICGSCHMHNGLARKEDFPYITYYCPHCNALNRPKTIEGQAINNSDEPVPASSNISPLSRRGSDDAIKPIEELVNNTVVTDNSPVVAGLEAVAEIDAKFEIEAEKVASPEKAD